MPAYLNEEINSYLNLLSDKQKDAVLSVIKAFAEEEEYESEEYSDEFKKELDNQYAAYQKGELITFSEEEVREKLREGRYAESDK